MLNSSAKAYPTGRFIRHIRSLDFTIVAEVEKWRVEYTVYDIQSWSEGKTKGVFDIPLWHKADATDSLDPVETFVETLEEAEPYLHGEVRWDGCSNWYFDEQDRVMLHGCSRSDVQRIGDVMVACWDWAKEMLPDFYS